MPVLMPAHASWAAAVLIASSLCVPAVARANGAFPDSGQVLLPRDSSTDIYASTNFGLLVSRDSGQTWRWICEEAIGPLAQLYQLGPSPHNQLFAQSDAGLHFSRDGGCSWQSSGGGITEGFVVSAHPDPADALRVLAVALPPAVDGVARMSLYESLDGGASFGPPVYVAPNGEVLSGVEIATTDPKTSYITMYGYEPGGVVPKLAHSDDSGASWTVRDASAALGSRTVRLIRVDPRDEQTVYLRVSDSVDDLLAITRDAGRTFSIALELDGLMSAFLLRSNGDIIVSGKTSGAQISRDGGQTFAPMPNAPGFRSIAERGNLLYATADNFADGFAVASSADGGDTWTPLVRFSDICEPLQCDSIRQACALPWLDLTSRFGIEPDQCLAPPAAPPASEAPEPGCLVSGKRSSRALASLALLATMVLAARRRPTAQRKMAASGRG